jgi:pimeloyl-ACP methyl ester carboxylesterase
MNLIYALFAFLFALLFILFGVTRIGVWSIERRFPAVGEFVDIDGSRIQYVHVAPPANPELPPIVFVHGASANLNDQLVAFRERLAGRAEMLFFDRPGHGWSERGSGNDTPAGQAATLSKLLDKLGIEKAIIVAHSFGGAMATSFALDHADKTAGLLFLSSATHPWPGGETSWYYGIAAKPITGWLFTQAFAYAAGASRMDAAVKCVFAPNHVPENYSQQTQIPLVLRPSAFRANAIDVNGLYDYATANSPRYHEIKAPTVVISGDHDTIIYARIHSIGLERDIPGAELVWVHNLGHKSDWVAPDLVVAAIEKVSGKPHDLARLAGDVEARIAKDAEGAECGRLDEPTGELAPQ